MAICRDSTLEARFLKKVMRGASPDDCWGWAGAKYAFGYGTIGTSNGNDGAHRVSYRLYLGEIPSGMCVCHKCDNPECANPAHLFIGTKQDNAVDRNSKGRGRNWVAMGSAHPSAKLTEEVVRMIREASGSATAVARKFGISESQARRIKNRQRWGHI